MDKKRAISIRDFKRPIILIHRDIIEYTGGTHGMRYEADLDLAFFKVEKEINKLFKKYLGKVPPRKVAIASAAILLKEIGENHPFVDGNKRTAFVLAKVYLAISNLHLKIGYREGKEFVLAIGRKEKNLDDIKEWLANNTIKIKTNTFIKEINLLYKEWKENGKGRE